METTKSNLFYTVAAIIFIAIKFIMGLIGGNFGYYPAAPYVANICYATAFILAGISLIMSLIEVAKGSSGLLTMLAKYIWMTLLLLLIFYATMAVFTTFLLVCIVVGIVVAIIL